MHAAVGADTFLRELAVGVARNAVGANEPLPVVLGQLGIVQAEYDAISKNPTYLKYLDTYTRELKENGFSFAAKCRVLAEELLPNLYYIASDKEMPAAARVKAIENLVTWADLKPKENAATLSGPGFSITISIGANDLTVSNAKALEVVEEVPVIELPPAPPGEIPLNHVSTVFAEPEDYAYAGDDVWL